MAGRMLYSRISNQGGRLSNLHCQFVSPTCYCYISMPNLSSAYKPQRKILFGTQQAYGILSPLSISRKGGERTEDW